MTPLQRAPSLDELVADPEKIRRLSPQAAADLLGESEGWFARVQRVRDGLLLRTVVGDLPVANNSRRLLSVEEAADRLGRSRDWLYRNAHSLPFTVQESKGGRLRFSAEGIDRYIRERQGLTR